MPTYTNPFTGQTISPADVGYSSLTISANTTLSWPINGTTSADVVSNIIECTATAASLNLVMPPATQVSVGQAIIIRNVGTGGNFAFNVTDNSGNVIVNIPISASSTVSNTYYVYITNNSTVNGTWSSIAMGIGVSSATAGALAGSGLKAIDTTLNGNTLIQSVSSSFTFLSTDRANLITWTGGAGTGVLPSPSLVAAGWYVIVKNNGTGILTIDAVGSGYSSVIDPTNNVSGAGGTTTVQVQIANSSIFVTDGTYWYSYALAQTNVFTYTQLLINVNSPALTSPAVLSSANAKSVIQSYTGTLAANLLILLPQTVQLYSLQNLCAGAFTLTFGISNATGTAAAGTTITVPANQAFIAISDGTNLYSANSAAGGSVTSLSLGNGTAAAPSLAWQNDATTGLYSPGAGSIGIAVAGTNAGSISANGLRLTVGISAGAF